MHDVMFLVVSLLLIVGLLSSIFLEENGFIMKIGDRILWICSRLTPQIFFCFLVFLNAS